MEGSEIAALVAGIGGVLMSLLAHRQATRANDRSMTIQASGVLVEERRLTFDQLQQYIENLQADLGRMREQLSERDRLLRAAQDQARVAQGQLMHARRENRELLERIERMEGDMQRLARSEMRPGGRRLSDPPADADGSV